MHEKDLVLDLQNLRIRFETDDGTVYAVTDGVDWYVHQTPGEF